MDGRKIDTARLRCLARNRYSLMLMLGWPHNHAFHVISDAITAAPIDMPTPQTPQVLLKSSRTLRGGPVQLLRLRCAVQLLRL
jgi:hypothetical protein